MRPSTAPTPAAPRVQSWNASRKPICPCVTVDRFQAPHMLLKHDEAIFTSVFVFLEKLQ